MMGKIIKGILFLFVAGGIIALLTWAFLEGRAELEKEREREAPIKVPPRLARTKDGATVVKLDDETQGRVQLKTENLEVVSHQPELVAFGFIEEDPSQTFVLRSPIGGVLRLKTGRSWPKLGESLEDGVMIGEVEPRWAPAERLDFSSKLAEARAGVKEATASIVASKAAFERAKALNIAGKTVSDRVVQEAEAKMKADQARLAAANEMVKIFEGSLGNRSKSVVPLPLEIIRGGELVELLAHPGEWVEGGQPILRTVSYNSLLVRVNFLPGESFAESASTARIIADSHGNEVFTGERIAFVPASKPTNGQAVLFRLNQKETHFRPGEPVTAFLPQSGNPIPGTLIPRSAIVRFGGQAWLYFQIAENQFVRRQVTLEVPLEPGWFSSTGFESGKRIVVTGAQTLLSEELKSQIETLGDEGKD